MKAQALKYKNGTYSFIFTCKCGNNWIVVRNKEGNLTYDECCKCGLFHKITKAKRKFIEQYLK